MWFLNNVFPSFHSLVFRSEKAATDFLVNRGQRSGVVFFRPILIKEKDFHSDWKVVG